MPGMKIVCISFLLPAQHCFNHRVIGNCLLCQHKGLIQSSSSGNNTRTINWDNVSVCGKGTFVIL